MLFCCRKNFYLLIKNLIDYIDDDADIRTASPFIGNLRDIGTDQRSSYTYRARGGVKLFAVDHSDMVSFAEKNPGLIMKMSSEITD